MIYGFNSEDVAVALRGIGEERLTGVGSDPAPTGKEVVFVKTPEGGIPPRPEQPEDGSGDEPEPMEEVECVRVYIDDELMLQESEDQVLPVINTSSSMIEGEAYIKVVMLGVNWVAVPNSGVQRVRFQINPSENFNNEQHKGEVTATIIDPLSSGLENGAEITVCDPRSEFMFAMGGSIGWATKGITYSDSSGEKIETPDSWIVESCTQAVVRIKATITQPLAPWETGTGAIPELTEVQSESYWPYVMWAEGEESGSITEYISNPHRFTANAGSVWLERREREAETQDAEGLSFPATGSEPQWEWHFVAVEKPTARWAQLMKGNGSEWLLNGGDYWEGFDPANNQSVLGAKSPSYLENDPTWCAVAAGTGGTGYLDDNTGYYIAVSTMSAMYGSGKLSEVVGQEMSDSVGSADPLLYPNDAECDSIKYKKWQNVIVFGNDQGGDCELEHEDPDPQVDFGGTYEKDVVTGIQVNAQGDLEFTTTTVKVCEPEDGVKPAPNTNITYLTSVGCEGGEFRENYESYNILGAPVTSGSQTVNTECIQNSFDWEYVFNNYVYNQSWWNVEYYDITYPDGCEPCGEPTGCCTYVDDNGNPAKGVMTEAECTLKSQSSWDASDQDCTDGAIGCCSIYNSNGDLLYQDDGVYFGECQGTYSTTPNATSFTFDEGNECGGGDCTDDCCCGIVSDVFIQVNCPPDPMQPSGSGSPVWMFEQSGSATGDGSCVWSVDGIWRDDDGNETNGTVTVTASGSDFTMTGQNPDGDSITGNAIGDAFTSACSSVGQWYFNHDNEPACQ
ncbi:MAG: hypothetical protein ACR2NF_00505 [Pirellulales bacterium]